MGRTDSKRRSGLWAGACSAGVGLLLTSVVWSQPEMLRVPSPVAYLAAIDVFTEFGIERDGSLQQE